MTQRFQVYRCQICGTMVKVVSVGRGTLVCCGQPMKLLDEKQQDSGKEKHVPVIEKKTQGIRVVVGATPHPMEDRHFIEWIEVRSGPFCAVRSLKPGEKPTAEFSLTDPAVKIRAYCTVHGLWTSQG